jgi:hypothetical protein
LTSNGELQIVQLHRTDAGTYVCVAYNGIGNSVEREIKLTVDGKSGSFIMACAMWFDGLCESTQSSQSFEALTSREKLFLSFHQTLSAFDGFCLPIKNLSNIS